MSSTFHTSPKEVQRVKRVFFLFLFLFAVFPIVAIALVAATADQVTPTTLVTVSGTIIGLFLLCVFLPLFFVYRRLLTRLLSIRYEIEVDRIVRRVGRKEESIAYRKISELQLVKRRDGTIRTLRIISEGDSWDLDGIARLDALLDALRQKRHDIDVKTSSSWSSFDPRDPLPLVLTLVLAVGGVWAITTLSPSLLGMLAAVIQVGVGFFLVLAKPASSRGRLGRRVEIGLGVALVVLGLLKQIVDFATGAT